MVTLEWHHFKKRFARRVESLAKRILSQISRLQALTHINAKSLEVSPKTADLLLFSTLRSYYRMLQLIDDGKIAFEDELVTILSEKLDEKFDDRIEEFDFVSHARPEYTEDVTVTIDDIRKANLFFWSREHTLRTPIWFKS